MQDLIRKIAIGITDQQLGDFVAWLMRRDAAKFDWLMSTRDATMRNSILNAAWHDYKDEMHIV